MRIGVPKEIKKLEFRVAMTAEGVREAVRAGHSVLVENEADAGPARCKSYSICL